MKVIYPEETLTLLAEIDEQVSKIVENYQQRAQSWQFCDCQHLPVDWRRKLLEDPDYQACLRLKTKVISISPCTYQFDAIELTPRSKTT